MFSLDFERQLTIPKQRTCGAAALSMVIRSLGFADSVSEQRNVWKNIKSSVPGRCDEYRTETFRLAKYAVELGMLTFIVRITEPERFFHWLTDSDSKRLIINHRIRNNSPLGHYSVFTGFDSERQLVYLHDPQIGPNREITLCELTELWEPLPEKSEITSKIGVIFFGQAPESEFLRKTKCPQCKKSVDLLVFPEMELFSAFFCPNCGKRIQ
ncbi:MAG: papain-like cysteine protease family protein [Thermoguttaceae bacterium]